MLFPALFPAGMAVVDTAGSVFMVEVYASAGRDPLRKLWYNLPITDVSVIGRLFALSGALSAAVYRWRVA